MIDYFVYIMLKYKLYIDVYMVQKTLNEELTSRLTQYIYVESF